MYGKSFFFVACAVSIIALAASGCQKCEVCQHKGSAVDMTAHRMDQVAHAPQEHWTDMADNAMLHDMTVADLHFIPHSTELSGTGAARLDRMATLLDTYGGTVRYETFETDDALVKKRLEHVKEYLVTTGCEMNRVEIKAMISGGRGQEANEAIIIDLKGTSKESGAGKSKMSGTPMLSESPK